MTALAQVLLMALAATTQPDSLPIVGPYPLTDTERASARSVAQHEMTERFLPRASAGPAFYYVEGIELKGLHLGEPFLEVALRDRSIDDYCNSDVDDPRLYASILRYVFPIYVADRQEPIIWMLIDRKKPQNAGGGLVWTGYYYADTTSVALVGKALRIRNRFKSQVSFVDFVDKRTERIIIDSSAGIRSGPSEDALVSMSEDARVIKHDICPVH